MGRPLQRLLYQVRRTVAHLIFCCPGVAVLAAKGPGGPANTLMRAVLLSGPGGRTYPMMLRSGSMAPWPGLFTWEEGRCDFGSPWLQPLDACS
jgi:hypothetical protein